MPKYSSAVGINPMNMETIKLEKNSENSSATGRPRSALMLSSLRTSTSITPASLSATHSADTKISWGTVEPPIQLETAAEDVKKPLYTMAIIPKIAARVDWEVNTVSRITPINTPRALEPTCVTTENGPRIRPKKNIKRNAIKMIGHSRFWTADFVIVVHMQG